MPNHLVDIQTSSRSPKGIFRSRTIDETSWLSGLHPRPPNLVQTPSRPARTDLVFHKAEFVFEFLDVVLRKGDRQKVVRKKKSQICYCLLLRSNIMISGDYLTPA